ncbi:MAG: hypothetical protein IT371_09635 [Deltaproteobacteria bacterium]|nr:hypothetical protein [Deltaproteobacteria bacterium]
MRLRRLTLLVALLLCSGSPAWAKLPAGADATVLVEGDPRTRFRVAGLDLASGLKPGTRIALLGASVDPISLAHLVLAALPLVDPAVRAQLGVDQVWIVPSPPRPDKAQRVPNGRRFAWTRLAARYLRKKGLPVYATDVELRLAKGGFRGTYQLLKALERRFPGVELSVIVGEDVWNDLPTSKWRNGLGVVREHSLFVALRGDHADPKKAKARVVKEALERQARQVILLPDAQEPGLRERLTRLLPRGFDLKLLPTLSSTALREAFARGERSPVGVLPAVARAILRAGSYR